MTKNIDELLYLLYDRFLPNQASNFEEENTEIANCLMDKEESSLENIALRGVLNDDSYVSVRRNNSKTRLETYKRSLQRVYRKTTKAEENLFYRLLKSNNFKVIDFEKTELAYLKRSDKAINSLNSNGNAIIQATMYVGDNLFFRVIRQLGESNKRRTHKLYILDHRPAYVRADPSIHEKLIQTYQ